LAEVMVDAINLRLVEELVHEPVEGLRRGEIPPERLLDDEPRPARAFVQPRGPERGDRRGERLRRQRQIEDAVSREPMLTLQRLDALLERLEVGLLPTPCRLIEHR